MDVMRRRTASKRNPSSMKRRFWYLRRRIVRQIADMTATANNAIEEAWDVHQPDISCRRNGPIALAKGL